MTGQNKHVCSRPTRYKTTAFPLLFIPSLDSDVKLVLCTKSNHQEMQRPKTLGFQENWRWGYIHTHATPWGGSIPWYWGRMSGYVRYKAAYRQYRSFAIVVLFRHYLGSNWNIIKLHGVGFPRSSRGIIKAPTPNYYSLQSRKTSYWKAFQSIQKWLSMDRVMSTTKCKMHHNVINFIHWLSKIITFTFVPAFIGILYRFLDRIVCQS